MGVVSALPMSVTLSAAHNTQGDTRMQPAKQLRADGCCRGATLNEFLLHCYTAYPIHRRSKQGTTRYVMGRTTSHGAAAAAAAAARPDLPNPCSGLLGRLMRLLRACRCP